MSEQDTARAIAEQAIEAMDVRWSYTCLSDLTQQQRAMVERVAPIILKALTRTADTARAQGRQDGLEEAALIVRRGCVPGHNRLSTDYGRNSVLISAAEAIEGARATPGDTP